MVGQTQLFQLSSCSIWISQCTGACKSGLSADNILSLLARKGPVPVQPVVVQGPSAPTGSCRVLLQVALHHHQHLLGLGQTAFSLCWQAKVLCLHTLRSCRVPPLVQDLCTRTGGTPGEKDFASNKI
jgi:hypothetical protein